MKQQMGRQDTTIGDLRRLCITLPQAARILDVDLLRIRRAVERAFVSATLISQGRRQVRTLNGVDVLGLRMGTYLERERSKAFYTQLKQASDGEDLQEVIKSYARQHKGLTSLMRDAAASTLSGMRSLDEISKGIDRSGRIEGTNVEAQRIAALVAGGMSADEIVGDYPNLDVGKVSRAVEYSRDRPKLGRPYPTRTAKSVLREGGGGGLAAAFAVGEAGDE